jgi:uncharacterized coiled-coil protein SlyX
MAEEQRILELESQVSEQGNLIKELYQAVINQQKMINDRVTRENELQKQLNAVTELVLTLGKKIGL